VPTSNSSTAVLDGTRHITNLKCKRVKLDVFVFVFELRMLTVSETGPCQQAQLARKTIFEDMASLRAPHDVVMICDRGTMDGTAFRPPEMWREALVERGTTEQQLFDGYKHGSPPGDPEPYALVKVLALVGAIRCASRHLDTFAGIVGVRPLATVPCSLGTAFTPGAVIFSWFSRRIRSSTFVTLDCLGAFYLCFMNGRRELNLLLEIF
jgi:hypothetical protein